MAASYSARSMQQVFSTGDETEFHFRRTTKKWSGAGFVLLQDFLRAAEGGIYY